MIANSYSSTGAGLDHAHGSRELDAQRVILRVILGVIGGGLSVSAFGLWLVPNAYHDPGLMLMKMGVSLFMLLAGLCLLVVARH